jgi:hypothetical protein
MAGKTHLPVIYANPVRWETYGYGMTEPCAGPEDRYGGKDAHPKRRASRHLPRTPRLKRVDKKIRQVSWLSGRRARPAFPGRNRIRPRGA